MPSMVWTIISFIIIFTIVVVSHEFGHYLIGRLNGINVKEFTIGMGPAIFKKEFKHTVLAIRLFPIGGACIFEGMDPEEEATDDDDDDDEEEVKIIKDEPKEGSFAACSVWGRIATVLAGPVFNIILAFLLSMFICWFTYVDLPVVGELTEGYPAAEAGLQPGDIITKVDNTTVHLWREVSICSLMNSGTSIHIQYERDGQLHEVDIVPQYDEEEDRYFVGLRGEKASTSCQNLSVFKYSFYEVRFWLIATYKSLGYMFGGHGSLDDLSGPVGIASAIDDTIDETSEAGFLAVVIGLANIANLLTVNLGVINLLPFPAIDGGRFLILAFEAVTKKKLSPEKEGIIHMIGFIILMILMVVVLFNDVIRIFNK